MVIKGLSNSKTFQRFALKTHNHIEKAKKVGTETFEQQMEELQKVASSTATSASARAKEGPPKPPKTGFPGFFSAFGKEIARDLGIGK